MENVTPLMPTHIKQDGVSVRQVKLSAAALSRLKSSGQVVVSEDGNTIIEMRSFSEYQSGLWWELISKHTNRKAMTMNVRDKSPMLEGLTVNQKRAFRQYVKTQGCESLATGIRKVPQEVLLKADQIFKENHGTHRRMEQADRKAHQTGPGDKE